MECSLSHRYHTLENRDDDVTWQPFTCMQVATIANLVHKACKVPCYEFIADLQVGLKMWPDTCMHGLYSDNLTRLSGSTYILRKCWANSLLPCLKFAIL